MKDLRSRAEKLARNISNTEIAAMSTWDMNKLIQEFQVYHVELEMQNEELAACSSKLQKANDKYADLYDLAPVGYAIINKKTGLMDEPNLAMTQLLGVEKRLLKGQNFAQFVATESMSDFYVFFKEIFEKRYKHMCELYFKPRHGKPIFVRLEGVEVENHSATSRYCHIVAIDIDERKKMEMELDNQVKNCTAKLEDEVALLKAEIAQGKKIQTVLIQTALDDSEIREKVLKDLGK